ncbi:MAG: tetratricopeptide repeat protein [Candidatus Acidiferrales bacterium]
MKFLSKAMACCALCALCTLAGGLAVRGAAAQTPAKKRIPGDAEAKALNDLLTAAQEAIGEGDFDAAAKDYQDYLAKKPDDATVHFDLGYAYTAMQDSADAKTEYEKAIALDPKMGVAYQNLGLTLLASNPAAAVAPLEKAAELLPTDARSKWLLGIALEGTGKNTEALEEYEAAAKLDEKDPDIRNSLGFALLKSGRTDDAAAAFQQALALHPTGATEAQSHRGLAETLIAEKNLDAAAAELETYLEAQPNDADARVERASALLDLGKDDDALAELDRAAAIGPEGMHALKMRSQIYYEKKRYADDVPVLQKAAALDPKDPDIPARLGHVYLEEKDYADAVTTLTVAQGMDPKANDVLSSLAAAEYLNKNYAAALADYDQLATRETLPPGNWFIRATCYDRLGDARNALENYKKFLELNTDLTSDEYFQATARVRTLEHEVGKK